MPRVVEAWRRWFFAPAPTAAIDRFRRLLALWTCAWAWVHLPHAQELYCRPILREGIADLWLGLGPPPWIVIAGLGTGLIAGCGLVIAGLRVRAATGLAAGCFAGLAVLDAGQLLAYNGLALLQWGIVALAPAGPQAPRWAWRLATLQLATMYGFAGLAKLVEGPGWWNGEALARVLSSPRVGQHLLSHWLPATGTWPMLAGWSVMAIEVFIALGIWHRRTRTAAAAALVLLHVGMALTLRVTLLFHALMLIHLALIVRIGDRSADAGAARTSARGF